LGGLSPKTQDMKVNDLGPCHKIK